MPCHLTIDYESKDWEAQQLAAPLCEGAQTYLKNSMKLPYVAPQAPDWLQRDQQIVIDALEHAKVDHEVVFSNGAEYMAHHTKFKKEDGSWRA